MVKIYDVSPEETDRILGKTSVRRHLRILEIKKGLRLYSLSELLDLYKIDKKYRSFSVVNDGRAVDTKWEVISTKSGVHSVDVDIKNKRITITSTIMKSIRPPKPGDIILR